MKIGIDARIYDGLGDQGRIVRAIISGLERSNPSDEYVIFLSTQGHTLYEPTHPRFRKVLVDAPTFSLAEQTSFLSILYREQLDLMHFMGCAAPIGYMRPFVVTIHDLLPAFYPIPSMSGSFARSYYRLLLRSVVRRARRVMTAARHVARDLSEMVRIEEESIETIRIDATRELETTKIQDRETTRKWLQARGISEHYFLSVGDIVPHANIARFLRAFARVASLDTYDLILVGKEDPAYHEVRETMIELGLQKRVHIVPVISDGELEALLGSATAVVSASLYESVGLHLSDAVNRGVPVVCSDIPGFRETLGDRAAYFRPLNIESIEEALGWIGTTQKSKPLPLSPISVDRILEIYREAVSSGKSA